MLFTPKYQEQQRLLHETGTYGFGGNKKANYQRIIDTLLNAFQCNSVLDYGCGPKALLGNAINPPVEYTGYDIVQPWRHASVPHDMVVMIDVLEHIEPDCLHDVLDHIQSLTKKVFFASVHTAPAKKFLEDGRNAHLIQKPMAWWFPKLAARFTIQQVMRVSNLEFFVIATRREDATTEDSS